MPLFIILHMLHHSKDTKLPFPLLFYKNFHSILYKIKNWNSDEYDQCSCYTISTSGHIQHSLKYIAPISAFTANATTFISILHSTCTRAFFSATFSLFPRKNIRLLYFLSLVLINS